MIPLELLSWIIAGAIGSWFTASLLGASRLGAAADWVAGIVGGILGALAMAFVTANPPDKLGWWFGVPAAFAGGLVITSFLRLIPNVRPTP
jgi:uncharacterized membrane protein YeaQ/YmgE (transglycosylase-associated protein family)